MLEADLGERALLGRVGEPDAEASLVCRPRDPVGIADQLLGLGGPRTISQPQAVAERGVEMACVAADALPRLVAARGEEPVKRLWKREQASCPRHDEGLAGERASKRGECGELVRAHLERGKCCHVRRAAAESLADDFAERGQRRALSRARCHRRPPAAAGPEARRRPCNRPPSRAAEARACRRDLATGRPSAVTTAAIGQITSGRVASRVVKYS